ncbi:hypothetical protein [Polycladidibacter stylochi]|uniref:hypothetical protein n=1 Tax=Polycladidibacter stylochi TaxID=1807766 RepID=UPI0008379476|nr:hypothetical protein [Pseudovibrio stylochi]
MKSLTYLAAALIICLILIYAAIGLGYAFGPYFISEKNNVTDWIMAFGSVAGPCVAAGGFWLILDQLKQQQLSNKIAVRQELSNTLLEARNEQLMVKTIASGHSLSDILEIYTKVNSHSKAPECNEIIYFEPFRNAILLMSDPTRPTIKNLQLRYGGLIFEIAGICQSLIDILPSFFHEVSGRKSTLAQPLFISRPRRLTFALDNINEADFEKLVAIDNYLKNYPKITWQF